jgi:hypothetical protein
MVNIKQAKKMIVTGVFVLGKFATLIDHILVVILFSFKYSCKLFNNTVKNMTPPPIIIC